VVVVGHELVTIGVLVSGSFSTYKLLYYNYPKGQEENGLTEIFFVIQFRYEKETRCPRQTARKAKDENIPFALDGG
jgi:hypothetical protein